MEVADLDRLAKEAEGNHHEAWNRSSKFRDILVSLNSYRERQKWLRDQTEELSRDLKIRPESDDWLQNELEQYDERLSLREAQEQTQKNRYNQLIRTMENIREKLQRKHTEAGKYQNQQASHDKDVEDRKVIIKQSAVRHNIRGYEANLDDMQINEEYVEKIAKLYKGQTERVDRARRETEDEKQKVQEVLGKIGAQKSGLQEQMSAAKQQASANERRMGLFQSELEAMEIDEGAKALSESKVQEIDGSLKQAKEDFKKSSWDAKIDDVKVQLRKLEDQVERTNSELLQGTRRSQDLAKLDHLKKELSDRKRGLETLRGAHNDRIRKIVREDWNLASLERDFQMVLDQRSRKLEDAKDRRNAATRDLGQVEDKLVSSREELGKAERELRECVDIVVEATGEQPDKYLFALDELQHNRDVIKGDVDDWAINRNLYTKAVDTAREHGNCYLCKRGFYREAEKSEFLKKMEQKIEKNTQKVVEEELKGLEEELQKSRSVGPKHSLWLHLSNSEIPRLQSGIRRLEESKPGLVQVSEDCDKEVSDRGDSSKDAELLSKPVASIVRFQAETSTYTEQIKKFSVAQEDAGITRPLDEVQEQLEVLNAQTRTKNSLLSKITAEKQQALNNIGSKEMELVRADKDLGTATYQLEKKLGLAKQIEDLRTSIRECRVTTRRLEDQIQALNPQFSEQETKLEDVKARGYRREQDLNQEASKLSDSLQKLRTADQRIQAYKISGGSSRLLRCEQDIEDIKREIEQTEAEQRQTIKEINTISGELRNHEDTRRTITDNLKYRQNKRELEDTEKEITRLSAENAEADVERLEEQQQYWHNQYQKHKTETTSKLATSRAKDDQLTKLLEDWQTDYKDAAQEYKEAHIKVEVSTADIGRRHRRLMSEPDDQSSCRRPW